ncbi:MAG TPA: hypothetical protein VF153_08585 [Candidatus Limnocylindria bacterium]
MGRTSASADRGARAGFRVPIALLLLAMLLWLLPRGVDATTGDPVLLNEALVSHTGVDTTEYVELFGVPGSPLEGLSLVFVEGDSAGVPGTIDRRVDFPAGSTLGGNGFYLVGNPAGLGATYGVTPDLAWGNESLENGSQTLALVQTNSIGDPGTIVTGNETVFDAVALTDAGATDRWFWSAPVLGPDDAFLPGGVRRVTDGVDTDTTDDWVFADDLLGPANTPTAATPYVRPTPTPSPTPTPTPTPEPTPLPVPGPPTARLWGMANHLLADGLTASRASVVSDRLERIDGFMQAGQSAAAAAQLQALANQVLGLSPHWISAADAQALASEADRLRAALVP